MAKKRIFDPAILDAENTPDRVFERGGWHYLDKGSSVKQFGRNKVLSGKRNKK